MPPKKRPPAPIDRPLSKAYLREFAGWSTAYPPGLSEPNSIRAMENVQITREGAARVRPGLQSYLRTKSPLPLVGSHELFYTENGKAYLVAVRETLDAGTPNEQEIVGFRVIGHNEAGELVMDTLAAFGFDVPSTPNVLSFTSATTYVKYLQIDNKIFALSDAPEGMLMFWVGTEKKAKKLASIVRPRWDVGDKLTAMHPTGTWILGSIPSSTRQNLCRNPDFETSTTRWSTYTNMTNMYRSGASSVGTYSLRWWGEENRRNWIKSPLHDVSTTGTFGWIGSNAVLSASGDAMQVAHTAGVAYGWVTSSEMYLFESTSMEAAFDLADAYNVAAIHVDMKYYDANGSYIPGSRQEVLKTTNLTNRRVTTLSFTPPQGSRARLEISVFPTSYQTSAKIYISNVCLSVASDTQAPLSGDDGVGYYWTGTPNDSSSVYRQTRDAAVTMQSVPATPGTYTASADIRGSAGREMQLELRALDLNGAELADAKSSAIGNGTYERHSATVVAPTGTTQINVIVWQRQTRWSETAYVDAVLIEKAATAGTYFSGNTPNAGTSKRRWSGNANDSISIEEIFDPTLPTPQVASDGTLVSNSSSKNRHTFGFFYTVSNELGEAAASQVTTIKVQRPWTEWLWKNPSGNDTNDPEQCHDQLTVTMPQEVFNAAVASGATHWTAYFYYQGPNDAPPVTATRFAEIDLSQQPDYDAHGFARLTPQMSKIGINDPLIPSETTRYNASNPVKGSQGLVASDRLILVGNPADPARISWSSGAPGDYHNFSTLLGGGSKQLTSGNLYVTAAVKLWQNPQSVDTLTVLNMGDDGRSNAYYMQPAQITSLSESISVMGFEEVTSMDGTVAPYGCEVVNNGLYRPLFHGLFKSTANNYNLSTKPVSDTIQNVWRRLQSMHRIVSAQLDSRIYYLVHNPHGASLEAHCRGNEVWVIDLAGKTPTWSRWLVQGVSLRAMDIGSTVMMSIVRPDGIFVFNEDQYTDERFNETTGDLEVVNIPWYLETNTQGANRAHDAWCNLQQANAHVGNFLGQMRYGIRGQDVNGKPVEIEKVLLSANPPPEAQSGQDVQLHPTEREDYLLIRKIIKEWVFFAGSVNDTVDDVEVPRFSGGQVNSVQYRYTPATVNVGYEYGSVETFEYGQSASAAATTDSGTPKPYVDLTRA